MEKKDCYWPSDRKTYSNNKHARKNSRKIDVKFLCVVSEQWESMFNVRQSYFHFIKSKGRGRL